MKRYEKTWNLLLQKSDTDVMYWVNKSMIPLGTLKPYHSYKGNIPESEIVTIKFDPVNVPFVSRKALNILCLGGSGDGKGLLMKVAWHILFEAGYYIIYIDQKSTEAGRAQRPWSSGRLPPHVPPKSIKLKHFMPSFNGKDYDHMAHNFHWYSSRLYDIKDRDMLRGLGFSFLAASDLSEQITKRTKLKDLELMASSSDNLVQSTVKNALTSIKNMQHYEVVSEKYPQLNLLAELQEEKQSIVISYNNTNDKSLKTFDIGLRIKQASQFHTKHGNKVPVMFFLDDAGDYAKEIKGLEYNFAVEQIKKIGTDYRSLGVYNWLSVQSLGLIDEQVAEGYTVKIISPYFRYPDSLSKINIPSEAIGYIKNNLLTKDKERHLVQWMLVTEDNRIVPFYPFTPPCQHFTEIYFPKILIEDEA